MSQPLRRPRHRDSKVMLEVAARVEFAEFGYAGARVDRIARRAGVNKQLVFYYFGSKLGLYESVVERVTGEAVQQPEPHGKNAHASLQLRDAFIALFDSTIARSDLVRLVVLEAKHLEAARATYEKAVGRSVSQIREVVVEGQGHGYFRDDVDADRVARQAVILALGYVAFQGMFEGPQESARTWRDATADLLVRALTW